MEDENKRTVGLFSGDTLLGKIASATTGEGSNAPVIWHAEVIATENIGILNKPNKSAVRNSEEYAKNWVAATIGEAMPDSPAPEWREID